MNDIAIRAEGLGKLYRIGELQSNRNLSEIVTSAMAAPWRRLWPGTGRSRASNPAPASTDRFWALKDISFDVKRGEVLGIIGRNGAGKSTLLKVFSRVTKPTEGRALISGRIGSLLEVGTGFHPELTGRENIYLNGIILGMKKAEIDRQFDEIVAFAEVEAFLDTPVKRYSSGMYVRLAFAVAAHLEPEILIVDEVLAVGDLQFQKKCLGKIGSVAREGRTVLFVSHNMASISTLCSSALLLERGGVKYSGNTADCIALYSGQSSHRGGAVWVRPPKDERGALIVRQITSAIAGEQPDQTLELDIILESRAQHKPAFLAVDILTRTGTGIMQALPQIEGFIADTRPEHTIKVNVQLPPLVPGQYLVTLWVGSHNTETYDEVREGVMFEILESPTPGRSYPHTPEHGYIVPHSTVRLNEIPAEVDPANRVSLGAEHRSNSPNLRGDGIVQHGSA